MAMVVWSFCQDVEKKFRLQASPANCEGPALAPIRKTSLSVAA